MPRSPRRRRWLPILAGATILAFGGAWYAWSFATDPVRQGWAAYARGDWQVAAERARERLKLAYDDASALRLLAGSLVHMGQDAWALNLYEQLGAAMTADDLSLQGIAMSRSGDPRALEVFERARLAAPNHPETLFELTCIYTERDRLADAAETGTLLAKCAGWEGRAEALLGAIEMVRNDPAGALGHWKRVLERQKAKSDSGPTPQIPPKELARAWLQVHQPADARLVLERFLAPKPDREASWLLSRAFLQEGEKDKALLSLKDAGSFRDEHPLVPEPSPFVGSSRCAECHSAIFQSQQRSRHANTFFRVSELGDLALPPESYPDPGEAKVTHTIRRMGSQQLEQETRVENEVYSAVVQYAFGSGDRGLTLVGRGKKGGAFELRLSHYRIGTGALWDVTTGQDAHPSESAKYLGKSLSEDVVRRCLACHVTTAQAILAGSGPGAADHGIGCEKCHGPGENHILAVKARFPDLAIIDPRMASGRGVITFCGECHSRDDASPNDPLASRFQAKTLPSSRCFIESQDKLDCITCHDPHRNAATTMSYYEAKCLSCHTGPARARDPKSAPKATSLSEASQPIGCPVNPSNGCIACHMPPVNKVVPHSSFTDHFIRVHRD